MMPDDYWNKYGEKLDARKVRVRFRTCRGCGGKVCSYLGGGLRMCTVCSNHKCPCCGIVFYGPKGSKCSTCHLSEK